MGPYLGDIAEDATVHFMWDSNDGSGGSITRSTDGTVSVYKDNGATQTVAGVTDDEDTDGLTGVHACTIDTSADGFYVTGSNYTVVLSAATIDTETVNAVLAHFSIENRFSVPTATVADMVDAVWDEILTGATHNIATSAGRRLRESASVVQVSSAVNDGSASTTVFDTDLTEVDDFWNDAILVFTSGALLGQSRTIVDFANTNGTITLDEALTSAPANAVTFVLVSTHVHPITQIADGVLDELIAGHTDAGSLGQAVADIETDATAILADTDDIGIAGAGLTDLGGMSNGMKAQVNTQVDIAFTTELPDSVSADGSFPTRDQALLEIIQFLQERAVSGTTVTVKKPDGSTSLMTFTLDAETPTSITRAT